MGAKERALAFVYQMDKLLLPITAGGLACMYMAVPVFPEGDATTNQDEKKTKKPSPPK